MRSPVVCRISSSVTLVAALYGMAVPATAQAANFYKDKTVTIMVPSGLGMPLGLYARL